MALNEALFRNANERIRDHAHEHGADGGTITFYCECSDRDCVERVEMNGPEYEVIRSDPTQFVVLPGHLRPEVEEVVRRAPEFLIASCKCSIAFASSSPWRMYSMTSWP